MNLSLAMISGEVLIVAQRSVPMLSHFEEIGIL